MTILICYWSISVIANKKNKGQLIHGTKKPSPLLAELSYWRVRYSGVQLHRVHLCNNQAGIQLLTHLTTLFIVKGQFCFEITKMRALFRIILPASAHDLVYVIWDPFVVRYAVSRFQLKQQ